MTRRVSLWIVIALAGALAATTAAVIVLATHDERGGRGDVAVTPQNGSPHAWRSEQNEGREGWPMPMMGVVRDGWGGRGEAPILPWALFSLAAGTAVGLLVAWHPWGRTPATVTAVQAPATQDARPQTQTQGDAETRETTETPPPA
jgi:hypothetical protein